MKLRSKNDLPSEGLNIETLMEALFYRDEFLSIASHELKTPLTSIKLQAQVFKRNTKNNSEAYAKEKVDRLVEQIDAQSTRLMKLIDDMLDISRIRSGQLKMTKSQFNLSEAVIEMAQKNSVPHLKLLVEPEIHFYGDRDRMSQVVAKLLDNAVKYGNGLPIEIKLAKKKTKITLSVKDFGQGISAEDQSKIFHRFQRGIAASEVSGLGLGLYIAKEITEAHGGKISVKSELTMGSTFSVDFKRQEHL